MCLALKGPYDGLPPLHERGTPVALRRASPWPDGLDTFQVLVDITQEAMTYLEDAPSKEAKLALMETLRAVPLHRPRFRANFTDCIYLLGLEIQISSKIVYLLFTNTVYVDSGFGAILGSIHPKGDTASGE